MAENVTPVTLSIDGFADREVMMVDYKFDQATDREGQIAGIPRGGKVTIRVKALNDGNNELIAWMLDPTSPKNVSVKFVNTVDGAAMKELKGTNCASTMSRSGRTVRTTTSRSRSFARSSRTEPSLTTILGSRRLSESRAEPIRALPSVSLLDAKHQVMNLKIQELIQYSQNQLIQSSDWVN